MNLENKCILVVGANPAWEKVLEFAKFAPGEVNRAQSVTGYPAGKATNFCRSLHCLGGLPGRQLTFLGGDTGTRFAAALTNEGLDLRAIPVHANTRTCINCLCKGVMTELVEPGTTIDLAAIGKFLVELEQNIPDAVGIAITGSIPQGTHPAFALNIALAAKKAGIPLLVDNWQNAAGVFDTGVSAVLKINAEELAKLTGLDSLSAGLGALKTRWPNLTAGITDGAEKAWLLEPMTAELTSFTLPKLPRIVNPLGAGDTCSAVFFSRLLSGFNAKDAFADALAAASASCLTDQAGLFDPQKALEIQQKIRC